MYPCVWLVRMDMVPSAPQPGDLGSDFGSTDRIYTVVRRVEGECGSYREHPVKHVTPNLGQRRDDGSVF